MATSHDAQRPAVHTCVLQSPGVRQALPALHFEHEAATVDVGFRAVEGAVRASGARGARTRARAAARRADSARDCTASRAACTSCRKSRAREGRNRRCRSRSPPRPSKRRSPRRPPRRSPVTREPLSVSTAARREDRDDGEQNRSLLHHNRPFYHGGFGASASRAAQCATSTRVPSVSSALAIFTTRSPGASPSAM